MIRKSLTAAIALIALAAVFVPSAVWAAGATSTPPAASTPANAKVAKIASIDVQLWPPDASQGGAVRSTVLIAGATLATGTPLPAVVRIPLPKGATVTWAGEIFNGGASADEQRPFKTIKSTGGDAVEIVATKTRDIQYEADYAPMAEGGGRRTITVDWVQSVPSDRVTFGFKVPATADDVKTTPAAVGQPQTNGQGERLYLLPAQNLALGAKYAATIDYSPTMAVPNSGSSGPDLLVPALIAALVAVLVAVVFLMRRQNRAR